MEKKKKVVFLDDCGKQCEHLILTESQLRLLKFLNDNDYFYCGFGYKVLEEVEDWMEI